MKAIIDRKRYDTSNADVIARWTNETARITGWTKACAARTAVLGSSMPRAVP